MSLFKYYPSNPKKLDLELEKKIFFHSLIFPAAFVFVFWIVEIIEQTTGVSFVKFGVYPLHLKGLSGILFSPFIHSNFNHLISNSVPFFILLFTLIYFYRRISYRIFFQMYILAGLCVWLSGREAWHIGASGVVYALAAFHFVSGIIRNDIRLLTISVVVVFLYGGMVWGIFPINPDVSWEGHLWGAVSGVVLAFYYRRYIIRRDKFDWEDEEENDDDESENQDTELLFQPLKKNDLDNNISHTGKSDLNIIFKNKDS
ncbi:MAG: rhomboid family intramembrane serine protease [Draconibacterium sp.]|nr:rhomboid family intramembrane serine protease [Draconibacterium sp.]